MFVFDCVCPECARLNSEAEAGRSERRSSLRRDMTLAESVHADSSKAEVKKKGIAVLYLPVFLQNHTLSDWFKVILSGQTLKYL